MFAVRLVVTEGRYIDGGVFCLLSIGYLQVNYLMWIVFGRKITKLLNY